MELKQIRQNIQIKIQLITQKMWSSVEQPFVFNYFISKLLKSTDGLTLWLILHK